MLGTGMMVMMFLASCVSTLDVISVQYLWWHHTPIAVIGLRFASVWRSRRSTYLPHRCDCLHPILEFLFSSRLEIFWQSKSATLLRSGLSRSSSFGFHFSSRPVATRPSCHCASCVLMYSKNSFRVSYSLPRFNRFLALSRSSLAWS